MDAPPVDADGDCRLDWSDADLFAFLETLGNSTAPQQPQEAPVRELESRTPEPVTRLPLNSQHSGSHSGDSSSGGRADHGEYAAHSLGQGARASNSGEHEGLPQRGLSVRKSTGERDKNKVAQRNFRQRKKEREKAKEQELEELMQKLKVAEQEREQLARHNTLLERAIVARDRVSADFSEASAYGLEEPKKPARILRPTRQWESNLDWTTDDVLQLTLGEEDVQWELKGSDVASMSIDDIKLPWKTLVNKTAAALVEAEKEGDGPGPSTERITLLVAEAAAIPGFIARLSPLQIHQWATSRLGDVPFAPKSATPALWRSIKENMALRQEQKTQLLQSRRDLMDTMAALLQERRMIQALIKGVEGTMNVSREDLSLKMWQLQEAVQRLRVNVRTVHDTKCRLFSAAWRKVLEPIQCAKLIVQAFPFPPDLLSVISTLVKEAGEPAAVDLLAMRPAAPSLAGFQSPVTF